MKLAQPNDRRLKAAGIAAAFALLVSGCGEPPTVGGPPDMRRLTTEQYHNIVHDVFGDHIEIAGRFDPLVRTEGLLALGARNAPITPAGFEQFYNVARSVSSQVGSADLLEGLGVKLALSPHAVGEGLRATGFGFLFAPQHHGAMKHAAAPRRELGVRTVFNMLGPLTNPAGANCRNHFPSRP